MATLTLDTAQGSLLDAVEARPAGRAPRQPARGGAQQRGAAARRAAAAPASARPAPPAAAGRTLDDLIAGAWESIAMKQTAACPLCGDDLLPRFGAGPQPVAGSCGSCGTELS